MLVAVITFKEKGKSYYFDPAYYTLSKDALVVVETSRGLEIGRVVELKEIEPEELTAELKPVLRIANNVDLKNEEQNVLLELEIINKTKELVKYHKLDMKPLKAEYTLDRKKLMIFFEAEERIDFRELVKSLSEIYHTRIELRQIGSRDAVKLLGSIGPCGYALCCTSFIGEFDTVGIKMVKNQGVALNTQKISGVCNKLFCCLKYEDENYIEMRKKLPDINDTVVTDRGDALVTGIEILKQRIRVKYVSDGIIDWLKEDEYRKN